jgi:hypothetical protein
MQNESQYMHVMSGNDAYFTWRAVRTAEGRASRTDRTHRSARVASVSARIDEWIDERVSLAGESSGARAAARGETMVASGAQRWCTARCASGRVSGHRRRKRLLLVALSLEKLALLVLAHLLAALLDHTTHG